MNFLEQYVVSVIKFKSRFTIHKSDIKTKKNFGAELLGTLVINAAIPLIPLYVYLSSLLRKCIVFMYDDCSIEDILGDRKKYWQSQLFTNVKGMNNISDLYSAKRKCCRKQ